MSTAVVPGLYVVATPLGNLQDISERAADVLKAVQTVLAEDTRRSRTILQHVGSSAHLESLHAHNEWDKAAAMVARMQAGESIAMVTDAGTPGVSDPGCYLVEQALLAGVKVVPVPGPSAMATALSVAGFVDATAWFVGFLPPKGAEREAMLAQIGACRGVVVMFEAPHRLARTAADLSALSSTRTVTLCRELTKVYEEVRRSTVAELQLWAETHEVLGEITLVLGPQAGPAVALEPWEPALDKCLAAGLSTRDAATAVAALFDVSRKEAYSRAVGKKP